MYGNVLENSYMMSVLEYNYVEEWFNYIFNDYSVPQNPSMKGM
jgi:hypothetical protein